MQPQVPGIEMGDSNIVVSSRVERLIWNIRGQRVLIDADLAALYGVSVKQLNQQITRNVDRFPEDFMFQLTSEEADEVVSAKTGRGGRRYRPRVFTEQGVAMLSSVLRSERAVQVNIEIMRSFVKVRQLTASHADLARKLRAMERKYDDQFKVVFDAIRGLMAPPPVPKKRRIGFTP